MPEAGRPGRDDQLPLAGRSAGQAGLSRSAAVAGADAQAGAGHGRRDAAQPTVAQRQAAGGHPRRSMEVKRKTLLRLLLSTVLLYLAGVLFVCKVLQADRAAVGPD